MFKKSISIIILILLLTISLTGCYDARSLETLSYAIALGIDEGENSLLKITFQLAINKSNAGSSTEESQNTTISSIECNSIDDGITLLNSHISKKLNLTHCKIIVFSESIAQKGIQSYINTLSNNVEVRPDCNIIISKCSAKDFLENSKPTLESLTARYYEVLLSSKEYTALTPNITLAEFVSDLKSSSTEAMAILGGIKTEDKTSKTNENLSIYDADFSYKASELPIEDKTSIEVLGIAVFKGFKLVGELEALDSVCYHIINNNLDYCNLDIPSPFSELRYECTNTTRKRYN